MILNKPPGTQLASVVTAATILAFVAAYTFYQKRKNSIPTKWKRIAKVKKLFVYPLKSGRRREIQNGQCTEFGISTLENNVALRDRSFVVYGEANNEFKTARTYPKLVLIDTSVGNNGEIIFTAPGQDPLITRIPESDDVFLVTLHSKEPCEAVDCGDEVAQWLSRFILEKPSGLRLGYHKTEYTRNLNHLNSNFIRAYSKLKGHNSLGLYQDLTSYLLINQASIDDLNSKIEDDVTVNNFRPNILVDGDELQAYAEENWEWIKIGNAVFKNVKPCTRCVLTTVHPDEGVFSKTREPLKSLPSINGLKEPSHIKAEGKKGVMGIHMGLWNAGTINVDDEVFIA